MAIPVAIPVAPRILTASAMKMEQRESSFRARRQQPWQKQAFFFTKIIPELNYASRFYAKMLSKLRVFPALRDSNDQVKPIENGPPVDLLDRIQDPGGGRSQILYSFGRLMFIPGEGYLFGRDLDKDVERWAFVNAMEIQFDGSEILWTPTYGQEPLRFARETQAQAYRFWTADPERSGEAESPMRAVLELGEELDILTKAVRSTAVSRMLQGILKVPAELSFGAEEPGVDDDPEANAFLEDIIDHLTGVVENAGSPEAAAPFLAEGHSEFLAALDWLQTHDPQNDYMEQAMRKEAIDRLAMGLDMPPEVLKGTGDANHWGSRQIMHDTWRSHGSVLAEQFCDDLADAYLRPALQAEGFADWRNVVVSYDDSNVVVPPDRTDDADKAYDRGTIDDAGYLQMKGIPSSYGASVQDKKINLAIKLRDTSLLQGTPFEVAKPKPVAKPPGPQPSTDAPPDAQEGPPPPGPAGVSRQESRASAIQGAAMMALIRCREIAGARVRSDHRKAPELAEYTDRPNTQVVSLVGQPTLKKLGRDPLKLVQGGTDAFCSYLTDVWAFTDAQANALSEMILVWAAKTLFEQRTPALPAGFLTQIERMKEISSALSEEALVKRNNESLDQLLSMTGDGNALRAG